MTGPFATPRCHGLIVVRDDRVTIIPIHRKEVVSRHRQLIEISNQRSCRAQNDLISLTVGEPFDFAEIWRRLLELLQQLPERMLIAANDAHYGKIELRTFGDELIG